MIGAYFRTKAMVYRKSGFHSLAPLFAITAFWLPRFTERFQMLGLLSCYATSALSLLMSPLLIRYFDMF